MDIELEIAVIKLLDRDGVVQILGILAVDRDRQDVSKIVPAVCDLFLDNFRIGIYRQGLDFLKDLVRESL